MTKWLWSNGYNFLLFMFLFILTTQIFQIFICKTCLEYGLMLAGWWWLVEMLIVCKHWSIHFIIHQKLENLMIINISCLLSNDGWPRGGPVWTTNSRLSSHIFISWARPGFGFPYRNMRPITLMVPPSDKMAV